MSAPRRGQLREAAILEATVELLAESGYDRLTMDAVATRARASKATIYRRWPGKAELVMAGLRSVVDPANMAPPDTGSLRGDLLHILRNVRDRAVDRRSLFTGLINAMNRDPELAALLRAQIVTNKGIIGHAIEENARRRGETVQNIELIQEVAPAQMFMRLIITDEPVDDRYLARLVDNIILPLAQRKARSDG